MLAVTIVGVYEQQGGILVIGKLKASGSYTTAVGGDTVNFSTATQDPLFLGMMPQIISSQPPANMAVWSQGGQITYDYVPNVGTTPANNQLKVISALGSELGTGNYPAAVTGDNIAFEAFFPRV